jgi:uncharacterized protein
VGKTDFPFSVFYSTMEIDKQLCCKRNVAMQTLYDLDKRKLLSALCHGSIFLSPLVLTIGIPIAILMIADDPVVKDNAKEAINFHLNVWLYGAIAGFISFFWWTIILLPLIWIMWGFVGIMAWIVPIFAILKCLSDPEHAFRYPFIFRIV